MDEAKQAMEATANLVHRRVLPAGYGPRRFPQPVWPCLGGFGCRVISTAQLGKVKEKTAYSEPGDWVLASFRWPETGSESFRPFRICNLHIPNSEANRKSARMPACAFNLLAKFNSRPLSVALVGGLLLKAKEVHPAVRPLALSVLRPLLARSVSPQPEGFEGIHQEVAYTP